MRSRCFLQFLFVGLVGILLLWSAGCGSGDTVVGAPEPEDGPPVPPPVTPPNYSGTFVVSPISSDGCGEGIILPSFFDVTVAANTFVLVGPLEGTPTVFANGSFSPTALRCQGYGYTWNENRPRPPATYCRVGFSLGADFKFSDADHFAGTIWLNRSVRREDDCFATPCLFKWNVHGTRVAAL